MNPFASRIAVRDPERFFGREPLVRELYGLLAGQQSCSIVGARRIGKTSLLHFLSHPSTYTGNVADGTVFVFVDLQELTGLGPDDLFYTIAERLRSSIEGTVAINPERDGTASGFRRMLGRLTDADVRAVVCLDEFEMLSQNGLFDNNFFAFLRGMCSNYNLSLVTASRLGLYELCHQGNLQTSQFWNIFVERPLGLLSPVAARALVAEPFASADHPLTDDTISRLLSLAGPHPMFLSIAAYHLHEEMANHRAFDWTAIHRRYFRDVQPHLKYIWDQLDTRAQRSALDLLTGQESVANTDVFTALQGAMLIEGEREAAVLVSDGWALFLQSLIADQAEQDSTLVATSDSASSTPMVIPATKYSGRQLGRYEIIEQLGQGGMAAVYRAYDPNFDRDVAVKMLLAAASDDIRTRFLREARMIAVLEHPAIVPVYDFGQDDSGRAYLVMRLMRHGTLQDLLGETQLPIDRVGQIIARVAAALDEAHAYGIVHRDLKPANVLFDDRQEAYLADFGIAHWSQADTSQTGDQILGTPAYMSPEQISSEHPIGPTTDVYALGVMLFEMLCGMQPFTADTPSQVMMKHIMQPVPTLLDFRSDLHNGFQDIIEKTMHKNPTTRYSTAGSVAGDIAALLRAGS
jgi:hypothetical protein